MYKLKVIIIASLTILVSIIVVVPNLGTWLGEPLRDYYVARNSHDYTKALAILQNANKSDSDSFYIYSNLGIEYLRLSNFDKARFYWQRANRLKADPNLAYYLTLSNEELADILPSDLYDFFYPPEYDRFDDAYYQERGFWKRLGGALLGFNVPLSISIILNLGLMAVLYFLVYLFRVLKPKNSPQKNILAKYLRITKSSLITIILLRCLGFIIKVLVAVQTAVELERFIKDIGKTPEKLYELIVGDWLFLFLLIVIVALLLLNWLMERKKPPVPGS